MVRARTDSMVRNLTTLHANQYENVSREFMNQVRQLLGSNQYTPVENTNYGLNNLCVCEDNVRTKGLDSFANIRGIRPGGFNPLRPIPPCIILPQTRAFEIGQSSNSANPIRPTGRPGLHIQEPELNNFGGIRAGDFPRFNQNQYGQHVDPISLNDQRPGGYNPVGRIDHIAGLS